MIIAASMTRFLCSLLLILVTLASLFAMPAVAASSSFDGLTSQGPPLGSLDISNPSRYSSTQLDKLTAPAEEVEALRSCLQDLQSAIQRREWSALHEDVASVLPILKQKMIGAMIGATDQLALSDRLLARAVSTEVFIHLERIDEADEVYDYQSAEANYLQALQDFDSFLQMLPVS